jgi:hypothetical protein
MIPWFNLEQVMEDWKLFRLKELRERMKLIPNADTNDALKAALAEAVAPFVPTVEQIRERLSRFEKAEYNGMMLEVGLPNINGITTISCGHLFSTYEELAQVNASDVGWEESCALVQQFTKNVDALYYARPGEDFTTHEALYLAREAGKSIVILEDLS